MLTDEPRVSVDRLRAAVRAAIEATSARAVARDVGMAAPSIRAFAAGSEPRASTVRKLTMWYLRYRGENAGGGVDVETARAAAALLLEHISGPEREAVRVDLYAWIARSGVAAGARQPGWVREVLREEGMSGEG